MRRSKTETTETLKNNVLRITPKIKKIDDFFSGYHFTRCNEDWKAVIPSLQAAAKKPHHQKHVEQVHIGIGLGEMHFISAAPELSQLIDVMIFFDINPTVLEHINTLLKILAKSDSPTNFIEHYKKSQFVKNLIEVYSKETEETSSQLTTKTIEKITGNLKKGATFLPEGYFFLSSQERFDACKHAATMIEPIFYHANFLNPEHVAALHTAIIETLNCKITITNITNLKEYAKKESERNQLQRNLSDLFKDNHHPLVLFSGFYMGESLGVRDEGHRAQLVEHTDIAKMEIQQAAIWNTPFGRFMSGKHTAADTLAIMETMIGCANDPAIKDGSTPSPLLAIMAALSRQTITLDSTSRAYQRHALTTNLAPKPDSINSEEKDDPDASEPGMANQANMAKFS